MSDLEHRCMQMPCRMSERDLGVAVQEAVKYVEWAACDAAHWYGNKFPELDCVHWLPFLAQSWSQASGEIDTIDTIS
jgi:hypothetical protein